MEEVSFIVLDYEFFIGRNGYPQTVFSSIKQDLLCLQGQEIRKKKIFKFKKIQVISPLRIRKYD